MIKIECKFNYGNRIHLNLNSDTYLRPLIWQSELAERIVCRDFHPILLALFRTHILDSLEVVANDVWPHKILLVLVLALVRIFPNL